MPNRREFLLGTLPLLPLATTWCRALADDAPVDPQQLVPVGGHWFLKPGAKPVYYFRDGERYLDLFSYHERDSNGDGIPNIALSHTETHLVMKSQGYPNHPTAIFPNSGNPNAIRVQDFEFRLPLRPRLAEQITRVPMGPIGVALNGVVFFNPFEQGGMNAVAGYSEVWLDSCCGHPQQTGVYHYHKYPSCVKSPFPDEGAEHSPVLGFAFDGFPVHGPYESRELMARDLTLENAGAVRPLDVCNGHVDEQRGYHYHVTPNRFPYVLGGYAGVPEVANNRGLRRGTQVGAIQDNAEGESPQDKVIVAVRPGTGPRGGRVKIELELNPQAARRREPPTTAPDWVQVGPYEAVKIERTGDVVTCELEIPADASRGPLLDCHLEFGREARPLVFKLNNAFRVV